MKWLTIAFAAAAAASPIASDVLFADRPSLDIKEGNATLAKRRPGDQQNPIRFDVNVGGWQDSAEFNCYVMLCLHGTTIYQRAISDAEDNGHRSQSGANLTPFQDAGMAQYHVNRITGSAVSAEEFPWASLARGGNGAWLVGSTIAEQKSQGGSISGAGMQTVGIGHGDWMNIHFHGYRTTQQGGLYCAALYGNDPNNPDPSNPDTRVCRQTRQVNMFGVLVVLARFVWQRIQGTRPAEFKHP